MEIKKKKKGMQNSYYLIHAINESFMSARINMVQ